MRDNLRDYMTEAEKQQVDALLEKARERMRNKQLSSQEQQFLFLGCQCEYYKGMLRQNQENQQKIDFEEDVQKLLNQICDFCKRHRSCFRKEEAKEGRKGEEDDELPF